jgi:hypothetical protein
MLEMSMIEVGDVLRLKGTRSQAARNRGDGGDPAENADSRHDAVSFAG